MSAANSAARKRTRTSDQGPRAVEDQAVQAAPRPGGPDSDEHGSELRANADPNPGSSNGLAAVDLDEADLDSDAGLDNFDDIDADDADLTDDAELQAALADEDLDEAALSDDVAEPADDLAGDDLAGDLAADDDSPDGQDVPDEPGADQVSAPAAGADAAVAAGATVVKIAADGKGVTLGTRAAWRSPAAAARRRCRSRSRTRRAR